MPLFGDDIVLRRFNFISRKKENKRLKKQCYFVLCSKLSQNQHVVYKNLCIHTLTLTQTQTGKSLLLILKFSPSHHTIDFHPFQKSAFFLIRIRVMWCSADERWRKKRKKKETNFCFVYTSNRVLCLFATQNSLESLFITNNFHFYQINSIVKLLMCFNSVFICKTIFVLAIKIKRNTTQTQIQW